MRRRRVQQDERGVTLVEMAATLMLLSIVMMFVYQTVDTTTAAVSGQVARLVNLDEARTLMAVTTKDLRTATRLTAGTSPFILGQDREVQFYANLNNTTGGPRKVRIYVDNTNVLISQVWVADANSVAPNYTYTGTPSPRFVGRYVANTNAQPIFEYYDINGAKLTTPLTSAGMLAVYSVKVTLVVRKQTTKPLRPVTLVNQVRLPNVDYQPITG
jgi:prepilin-type N-terminal cleavage/methylation domain-containing protein